MRRGGRAGEKSAAQLVIPRDLDEVEVRYGPRSVTLTNLRKLFWPALGITKGDLLQYYARIAPVLLPHLRDRPMVMKRYPNGAAGDFFFMKRAPAVRPAWIETCRVAHGTDEVIDFPVIQDLLSLLWVVNLGCIDLNQWYATADHVDQPDYLHFDLDPVDGATFAQVVEAALAVHEALDALRVPNYAKTSGSRGMHVYVPIVRGPAQKSVWQFAESFAHTLVALHPQLLTVEYRISKRPPRHVLIDYNQNAWGRTLASVYSVRPHPRAAVSTPVTWEEVAAGITTEMFRIDTVPQRVQRRGDLWAPLLAQRGRYRLERFL